MRERERLSVCVGGWVGKTYPNSSEFWTAWLGEVWRGSSSLLPSSDVVNHPQLTPDVRGVGAGSGTGSGAVLSSVSSSDEVYHPQLTEETRWTGSGRLHRRCSPTPGTNRSSLETKVVRGRRSNARRRGRLGQRKKRDVGGTREVGGKRRGGGTRDGEGDLDGDGDGVDGSLVSRI